MHFFKTHGFFLLILLASALLRLLPLCSYQFTYDELSALDRVQFPDVATVLEKGVKIDAHPALIQLLLFFMVRLWGYTTWIIKLPFILMSLTATVYAYLFSLRHFGRSQALAAACFFSFSLIFVFYAPIARPYVSGVFFCTAALFHLSEIVFREQRHLQHYLLAAVFALLAAFNHHISALFAFSAFSGGLFFEKRKYRWRYLLTAAVTVIFYLPHLSITLFQLGVPGIGVESGGWLTRPQPAQLLQLLSVLCGTGWSWLGICAVLVFAILAPASGSPSKRLRSYLILLFVSNALLIYFYSLWRSPIFQFSVALFSGLAFVLFICSFMRFGNPRRTGLALSLLCGILSYETYFRKNYLGECVETVFEYQFRRTAQYEKMYGKGQLSAVFFDCDTLMRRIYLEKHGGKYPLKISTDRQVSFGVKTFYPAQGSDSLVSSLRLFGQFMDSLRCNYLALSSASPLFCALARDRFPYLVENTQTQGVNYRLYSKIKPAMQAQEDRVVLRSSVATPGDVRYSDSLPRTVQEADEFPFSARALYRQLLLKEGQVLLSRAVIAGTGLQDQTLESVISCNTKDDGVPFGYAGKAAGDFVWGADTILTLYSDYFAGTNHSLANEESMLTAFIWNRGRKHFRIREFELKVIDYWPGKWNLWK